MSNFGNNVNSLFNGEPVTLARLALANSVDRMEARAAETKAEVSALEKVWESRIKSEYQIDKLSYDQTAKTPAIDIPKVTPSKRAEDRTEYLRDKFKIGDGFQFSATSWNGGCTRIERAEGKQAKSNVMEAYGSYKGKPFTLSYEIH
jgi:hypothetical protein